MKKLLALAALLTLPAFAAIKVPPVVFSADLTDARTLKPGTAFELRFDGPSRSALLPVTRDTDTTPFLFCSAYRGGAS